MQSTRRKVLALAGASIVSSMAGCSVSGSANSRNTTTTQSKMEVRLKGPETDLPLFGRTAVATVGKIKSQNGSFTLQVILTDEVAAQIRETFRAEGVHRNPDKFVLSVQDEKELTQLGIAPEFAKNVAGGEWDGSFRLVFKEQDNAKTVQEAFACGAKSAPVSCDPN